MTDTLQITLPHSETPLMILSDAGNTIGVVSELQSLGSVSSQDLKTYINRQNDYGNTALMLAANHNHLSIVSTLLNGGADPKLENIIGQTAADMANLQGFNDIVDLLVQFGATRPAPIVLTTPVPPTPDSTT